MRSIDQPSGITLACWLWTRRSGSISGRGAPSGRSSSSASACCSSYSVFSTCLLSCAFSCRRQRRSFQWPNATLMASSSSWIPTGCQLSMTPSLNSSHSSGDSRSSMMNGWGERMPCLAALRLERALPSAVLGPPPSPLAMTGRPHLGGRMAPSLRLRRVARGQAMRLLRFARGQAYNIGGRPICPQPSPGSRRSSFGRIGSLAAHLLPLFQWIRAVRVLSERIVARLYGFVKGQVISSQRSGVSSEGRGRRTKARARGQARAGRAARTARLLAPTRAVRPVAARSWSPALVCPAGSRTFARCA